MIGDAPSIHSDGTRGDSVLKVRLGPAGVHIFDRLTGTHILLDEVSIPEAQWAPAPRSISVALTNACDLQCPHCYAPKHSATLDTTALSRWLKELDAHGCIAVGFGGGEPTLSKDLAAHCRFVTEETQMAVSFTTHGHHITERLVSRLQGFVHFVRVSMDGVGATYERIRGRAFDHLLNNLPLIGDIAPFGVNYVVNHTTISDLTVALSIAEHYGAKEFLLLPEQPSNGRPGIDPATVHAMQTWIQSYAGPVHLATSSFGSAYCDVDDPLSSETGLRAYAHIDASGLLKRSSFDSTGVAIGPAGVIPAIKSLRTLNGDRA